MSACEEPTSNETCNANAYRERRWYTHHRYLYLLAKIVFVALVTLLLWRIFSVLSSVLMPAVVALVLAYVFDPLIDIFERRGINRTLVIAVLVLVLLMLVAVFVMVVLPAFIGLFVDTVHKLPGWVTTTSQRLEEFARTTLGYSGDELDDAMRKALAGLQGSALGLLGGIGSSVTLVVNTLLVPIFFFYFLRDFDRLKLKPLLLIPPRFHARIVERARVMDSKVGGWVRGQIQVACILAALYAIGLTIVGVKLGFVIGIVAGLLNVVPYVGAAIGIGLSVLMVLIAHDGWYTLATAVGVFVTVAMLDSYFITPRLVGAKVGLHPLMIIAVVLIGGSVFGLVGLLFAVPFTAAVSVLLADAMTAWRNSEFWTKVE